MADRELNEVHVPDRRHHKNDGTPIGPFKRFNAWFLSHFGILTVAFGLCGYLAIEIFNPFDELGDRVTNVEAQVVEIRYDLKTLHGTDSAASRDIEYLRNRQDANDRLTCLTASDQRLLLMAASEIPCGSLLQDLQIPLARRQRAEFERAQDKLP